MDHSDCLWLDRWHCSCVFVADGEWRPHIAAYAPWGHLACHPPGLLCCVCTRRPLLRGNFALKSPITIRQSWRGTLRRRLSRSSIVSADEGFCLPAWGTYTHTTNRLHGDALIIAYTIRDPMQPVCMTHFATLSENIIATPAYGSPTGAASPVMKRLFGRKLPLSCVSVSARMSYSNWVHSSRCVKESPPQFHVASFNFAPTRTFLLCVMALRYYAWARDFKIILSSPALQNTFLTALSSFKNVWMLC